VGPAVRWFTRPELVGRHHVPTAGPVILAPNHLAEVDSLVLSSVSPRRPTFVAKSEYFRSSGVRGLVIRWVCTATGQVPVDRHGGSRSTAALTAAQGILSAGGVWAIYPEGTRSPDGRLYRGHTGVARVALAVPGVTLIPVAISGTREVDAPGRRGWRRGKVRVEFGNPLDLSQYGDDPADWRRLTGHLIAAVRDLTGQPYINRYPTREEREARDAA
jgi:1-acyl-sn-glycerol-3-phosphate acyltransferase